jgi:hypothetical protein
MLALQLAEPDAAIVPCKLVDESGTSTSSIPPRRHLRALAPPGRTTIRIW